MAVKNAADAGSIQDRLFTALLDAPVMHVEALGGTLIHDHKACKLKPESIESPNTALSYFPTL